MISNALPVITYTVCACLFMGIGYVTGNAQGDAATFRNCAFSGEAAMVDGSEIQCRIVVRPQQPAPASQPATSAPQNSRPKADRPFPPVGFEKIDQG
jgi:hypothetical protein